MRMKTIHFLLERVGLEKGRVLFKMKAHKSIHLYVSSCPCGNATIRKWAKGGSRFEGFDDDDDAESRTRTVYNAKTKARNPFLPLDVQRGSVAVAMKKATTTTKNEEGDDNPSSAARRYYMKMEPSL